MAPCRSCNATSGQLPTRSRYSGMRWPSAGKCSADSPWSPAMDRGRWELDSKLAAYRREKASDEKILAAPNVSIGAACLEGSWCCLRGCATVTGIGMQRSWR